MVWGKRVRFASWVEQWLLQNVRIVLGVTDGEDGIDCIDSVDGGIAGSGGGIDGGDEGKEGDLERGQRWQGTYRELREHCELDRWLVVRRTSWCVE